MRNFFSLMLAMVLTILMAGPSLAESVAFDAGTIYYIGGVQDYATSGDMMDGMTVQVFFAGGGSQTAIWGATGSGTGAAGTNTGWSLSEGGDTFGVDKYGSTTIGWILTNTGTKAISQIIIDAFPGHTVFDTTFDGATGTTNSQLGWDFQVKSSDPSGLTISATYRDKVALLGDAPVGDLYRYLELDFGDQPFGQGSLNFRADTDNIYFSDIPVPLPGTFFLLSSGLVGLGIMRRKWSLKK